MALETRLRRDYWVRMALISLMFAGSGLMLIRIGVRLRSTLGIVAGIGSMALWCGIALSEYLRGARVLDSKGVTRRDGKRFEWSDLRGKREVRGRLPGGEPGPLNHIALMFPRGQVRVFPFTLENAGEVMRFIENLSREPEPPPRPRHETCSICSQLKHFHRGFQKGGREEEDTFLPGAAAALKDIKEVIPGHNRTPILEQCPECGTYYLYEREYEFLVSGSEDEQRLSRLTDEEAAKYLGSARA